MSKYAETTNAAIAGQRAAREGVAIVPFLYSSPNWLAFMAGRALAERGDIVQARMSRGYSVKLATKALSDWIVTFDSRDLNREPIANRVE